MFFYNKIPLICSERLVVNTLGVFAFRWILDDIIGIPYINIGGSDSFICFVFSLITNHLFSSSNLPTFFKKLTDLLGVTCLFTPMKNDDFLIAEAATDRDFAVSNLPCRAFPHSFH